MRTHPLLAQLAEERRASGLSQPMVARELSVSPKTLSLWETGHHQPHLFDLERLAALLGYRLALVPVEEQEAAA